MRALTVLLVLWLGQPSPNEAVARFIAAYNAHDVEAERASVAPKAIIVRNGARRPIDWSFERGLRRFDAVTGARFRYTIKETTLNSVEIALFETNAFLSAIGIDQIDSQWRYVVAGGMIQELHHLSEPNPAYVTALRRFSDWVRLQPTSAGATVLDGRGNLLFNERTAEALLLLAREWERAGRPTRGGPAARRSGKPFRDVVNDPLRRGLLTEKAAPRESFADERP